MYAELAHDPKVQVLSEVMQRRYVMVLCLHCDNKLLNRPDDEIALSLRVTVEEWNVTKMSLIERGLLSPENLKPKGWDKRQYISDIKDPTSAERQRKYRERKRNGNVTSRSPESDTDTDTDKKKERKGSRFTLTELQKDWEVFCKSDRPDLMPSQIFKEFRDYWISVPGQRGVKLDWFATWRNWVRNSKGGSIQKNLFSQTKFEKQGVTNICKPPQTSS